MLIDISAQPRFVAVRLIKWTRCWPSCELVLAFEMIVSITKGRSLVSLALVNLERFLAIVFPFFYTSWVNNKSVVTVSIVSWLSVTGFLTVIKFAVELKARVVLTSLLFLVIIILAWSFTVVVYITARSTRKQISAIISSITLHLQKKQSDSGAKMLELQNRKASVGYHCFDGI